MVSKRSALDLPSEVFQDIVAKIQNAEQRFADFDRQLGEFWNSTPYAGEARDDTTTRRRVWVVTKVDPIPRKLRAAASDVISNLRSALDHVAYQLVLQSRAGLRPTWNVYFPIAGSSVDYPNLREGHLKGVPRDVLRMIDDVEPYKGGLGHALWQLNELSKIDKHRLLVGTASTFGGISIREIFAEHAEQLGIPLSGFPDVFVRPADGDRQLKVGDALFEEGISVGNSERRFSFVVKFSPAGIADEKPAINALADIANLAISTIRKFEHIL